MASLRALLLVVPLLAASAGAAPRISVVPFTGRGAKELRSGLLRDLCSPTECVPSARVMSGKRTNWKKVKAQRVEYVVAGKVAGSKRKQVLQLIVYASSGKARAKRSFPMSGGELSGSAHDELVSFVHRTVGAEAREPSPPPPPPVLPPEPPPEPEPEPEPTPPEPPPEPVAQRRRSAPRNEEVRRALGETPVERKLAFISLEVGSDIFSRSFGYTQPVTANLRSYSAPFIVAPSVKVEVQPFSADPQQGLISGLGFEAAYATAVGLKSRRVEGPQYPTSLSRLHIGAKLKLFPFENSGLTVVPAVGFRQQSFSVGPATDGTTLDGLPGVSYSALVLGAGAELPFSGGRMVTFARFAYLPVLGSGEIVSAAYFPRGSASGLEGALGLGYRLVGELELRLTGQITRFGIDFKSEPGDAYVAASASDVYLGVNAALRYAF